MPNKKVRFQVHGWSHDNKQPETMTETATDLNYFTCTLGQAAKWNHDHPHPFDTVNDLIDEQAKELRQRPAVNFPGGCNTEDGHEMKSGRLQLDEALTGGESRPTSLLTCLPGQNSRIANFGPTRWQRLSDSVDGYR